MRNTSRSHFIEVVLPAFESFASHYVKREMGLRRDTKNAAILAEALRDLPEHVYSDFGQTLKGHKFRSSKEYRESFWSRCRSYEIICDFANAWKHRRISRSGKTLSSLDDVKEYLVHIRYEDERGFYYGCRKIVVISLLDGRECEISGLLAKSIDVWTKEVVDEGIIPSAPNLSKFEPVFYSREELGRLSKMKILGQKGEYFEMGQKMFVFRPGSNSFTPPLAHEVFCHKVEVEFEISDSLVGA